MKKINPKRLYMSQAYFLASVEIIAKWGLKPPTECTVRSYINDIMDAHAKAGFIIHEGYNQQRAHRQVCKLIEAQRNVEWCKPASFRMAPTCQDADWSESDWCELNKS